MNITVTFACGHTADHAVYVSDYNRQKYGKTEESEAEALVRASARENCGACYQANQVDIENNRVKKMPIDQPKAGSHTQPMHTCAVCENTASMFASLGMACPDHYDELSG